VVGVGASAGGLEALCDLVEHLTTRSMALVVVQHLAPEYETMMDQILARHTDMDVALVSNGVEVEAGRVYLIPPGKEMIMSSGRLLLTDRDENENPNLPIDTFFRSLAQELRDRAIAIVLSGTGRDGSRGIRAVHEAGGLTLAQTATSAQFDSMPRAAVDTGCVDLELEPEKMGRAMARYAQVDTQAPAEMEAPKESLQQILETLRRRSGIDFRQYKDSTILRRLQRRMALGRIDDVDEYARRVVGDPTEADALYRDLLVGVTRFFRDEEAWELLADHVDAIVGRLGAGGDEIRVWVAGCATGPEAYTMAILFGEAFRKRDMEPRVKIFATDVHRQLLERASQGVYDDEMLEGVPEELRERWFRHRRPGSWIVAPALREMLIFAHHDVTRDPPFTRLDLLSCRNMLIYLRPAAQQRVLTLFHFALKTSGLLLLGPSESPGKLEDEFLSLDNRWKLYRKRRDIRLRGALRAPDSIRRGRRPPMSPESRGDAGMRARDRLLTRFAPPSVVVNARGEVEHTMVGGGRFLDARDGDFSHKLLDMLDGSLRTAVSAATHRAWRSGESASYDDVTVEIDGEERTLDIHAEPLNPSAGDQSSLVVSFLLRPLQGSATSAANAPSNNQLAVDRVNALEDQLAVTKENLQAALEEMETSNEELQATNEELIASNEELQSTNEELSSVNEELVTVNSEHQEKIAELQTMTADLENLLSSTEVHVLFLDSDLRIRRFTPLAGELFRLRKSDIGRPITDFRHRLDSEGLVEDAQRVLDEGEPVTHDVTALGANERYLVRILPYTMEGATEGVVFTFLDVTLLREAQRERERLTAVVEATPDFVGTASLEGGVLTVNEGGRRMLGYGPDDELPESIADFHPEWAASLLRDHAIPYALEHGSWLGDSAILGVDGEEIPISQLILAHSHGDSGEQFISTIARDMTEVHEHARELEEADRRKDIFLATLSHELRNPLHAIQTAVQLLKAGGSSQLERTLPVLERQGENLERLLEDLLDISRITAGQVHLRLERVELGAHLRAAADAVVATHPEANLDLTVPANVTLDADPTRLEQMIGNLLSNAVKYSPDHSPVSLVVTEHEGWLEIAVEDSGQGLSEEDLSTIFEPFVREGDEQTAPGLGLGLALVRQLAELHGGAISASSNGRGEGSRFVLRLPRRGLEPEASMSAAQEVPKDQPSYRSVLVIDDNRDAVEMLSQLLAARDFEVHVAGSFAEGWEALTTIEPDVALVDIGLPDGSGLDLARRIHEKGHLRPKLLVAVSGYGQPGDVQTSEEAGFDHHVVKPVRIDELLSLLGVDA
jgi:two-component system CheB/CheR fusion protein